ERAVAEWGGSPQRGPERRQERIGGERTEDAEGERDVDEMRDEDDPKVRRRIGPEQPPARVEDRVPREQYMTAVRRDEVLDERVVDEVIDVQEVVGEEVVAGDRVVRERGKHDGDQAQERIASTGERPSTRRRAVDGSGGLTAGLDRRHVAASEDTGRTI